MSATARGQQAGRQAARLGQRVRGTRGYRALVAVGLGSYGLVHLLIAGIALRLAFGQGGRAAASQQGALKSLAQAPLGPLLLVVAGVGLLSLAVWQLLEAILGHGRVAEQHDERRRTLKRLSSVGRSAVYLVLAVSAFRIVAGAGSSGSSEQTLSSRLLQVPFGRVLVVAVGLAVAIVGVTQIVKGVRTKFTEDLSDGGSRPARVLGVLGYVTKGLSLVVVGGLFGWAALSSDADKAGGLDAALHTVRSQPFGPFLLTGLAVGFAAFGVYCVLWANSAET